MRAALITVLALSVGCGGAETADSDEDLPAALRSLTGNAEVTPFSGWSANGLTLYRVAWSVPDRSSARIVAVDANGALVEGGALMDRLGDLDASEMTRRVFDVLLEQQGGTPLMAAERSSHLGTDAQWSTVRDPRIESGSLIFFSFRGEMSPELVENRVRIDGWQLSTRPADELVVATDEPVSMGDATCHAIARCGCWSGCERIESVRMPEGRNGTHRVVGGENEGEILAREEQCYERRCLRVCWADTEGARCDDGAFSPVDVPCTGACAPTEAPYHCVTYEDRCEREEHPQRAATAPTR